MQLQPTASTSPGLFSVFLLDGLDSFNSSNSSSSSTKHSNKYHRHTHVTLFSFFLSNFFLFAIYLSVSYRSYASQTWPIKLNAVSSRQRLCRYCGMDALLGRYQNSWRKSQTAITQECCEQYWTGPGSNTPQSTNYTATYLPSQKTIQVRRTRHADTAGEAGTNSLVMYSYGPPHMAEQKQDD